MTEINEIKRLIAESEGVELSNWNTVTHAQREAWASIETQGRAWIIEFITTIESQKEEIKDLKDDFGGVLYELNRLEAQLDLPKRGYLRNSLENIINLAKTHNQEESK